jgi:NhaP-type Na+/H+ or K+/H+ antiporter
VSPAILYLAIGAVVGPIGLGFVAPDVGVHGRHIEAVTEVALIAALFAAGLRMRPKLDWFTWRRPLRFALLTPLATALLVTITAQVCLGLDLPTALLLAAILAPIDLALTADVRLPANVDESEARIWLTTESVVGLALAVPLALLALGLRGTHDIGRFGLSWAALDLLWPIVAGLALGWWAGVLIWRLVTRTSSPRDAEVPDELVAVGTIALASGLAMLFSASTLCAVFAAGLALARAANRRNEGRADRPSVRFQSFATRLERVAMVAGLLLLGALLPLHSVRPSTIFFALLLLIIVRPLAAHIGLTSSALAIEQRRAVTWFGIRGMVSLYLLALAVNEGLGAAVTRQLTGIVIVTLVVCIAIQDLTAAPPVGRRIDQRA